MNRSEKETRILGEIDLAVGAVATATVITLAEIVVASELPIEQTSKYVLDRFILEIASRTEEGCPICALRDLASKAPKREPGCLVCASRTSAEYPLGLDWQ